MKTSIISLLSATLLAFSFFTASSAQAVVTDIVESPGISSCVQLTLGMTFGSRDSSSEGQVSDLQFFLNDKGYLRTEPTGYFGMTTLAAVKEFQGANGITQNGVVGPITRGKIADLTCNDAQPVAGIINTGTVTSNTAVASVTNVTDTSTAGNLSVSFSFRGTTMQGTPITIPSNSTVTGLNPLAPRTWTWATTGATGVSARYVISGRTCAVSSGTNLVEESWQPWVGTGISGNRFNGSNTRTLDASYYGCTVEATYKARNASNQMVSSKVTVVFAERGGNASSMYECNGMLQATPCASSETSVCGQPPMPYCPVGAACTQAMPQPRTYVSRSAMLAAGASYVYEGECQRVASQQTSTVTPSTGVQDTANTNTNTNTTTMNNQGSDIFGTGSVSTASPSCVSGRIWNGIACVSPSELADLSASASDLIDDSSFSTTESITFTGSVENSSVASVSQVGLVDIEMDWGRNGGSKGQADNSYDVAFTIANEQPLGSLGVNQSKPLTYVLMGGVAPVGEHRFRFNVDKDGTSVVESNELNNRSSWINFTVTRAVGTAPKLLICPDSTATVAAGGKTSLALRYWANKQTVPTCMDAGYVTVTESASWSSNDTAAVTVNNTSNKGQITGIRLGWGATISATYSGLTATRQVSVVGAPSVPGSIVAKPDACGTGRMIVSWSSSNNASEYILYNWSDNREIYRGPNTTVTLSNLPLGIGRMYYVKASNANGTSVASNLSAIAMIAGSCAGANLVPEVKYIGTKPISLGDKNAAFQTIINRTTTPISSPFTNELSYRVGFGTSSTQWVLIKSQVEQSFGANTIAGHSMPVAPLTETGFVQFKLCLDTKNNISEAIETDNCAETTMYVTPPSATPRLRICSADQFITTGSSKSLELRFWENLTEEPTCDTSNYKLVTNFGTWSTSRSTVAAPTSVPGTVSGVSEGSATITATFSGYTASKDITVESTGNKPRVRVCPTSPTVALGGFSKLELRYWSSASTTPDCTTGGYIDVSTSSMTSWVTSDAKIATVENIGSNKGRLLGVSLGSTIITGTYSGVAFERAITVTAADQPDLVPVSITQHAGMLVRGASGVTFKGDARNATAITSTGNFVGSFSYRWSTIAEWIPLPSPATQGSISGNASFSEISSEVPLSISGTLYVQYCVDSNNTVNEGYTGENNNCITTQFSVVAVAQPRLLVCPATTMIPLGSSSQLRAYYWPTKITPPDCVEASTAVDVTANTAALWSSSNSGIIAVDMSTNKGKVSASSVKGSSSVSVSYMGLTAAATVKSITAPAPPVLVKPELLPCTGEALISWQPSADATEYILRRNSVEIYRGSVPSFVDSELTQSTNYSYDAKAINQVGSSTYSSSVYVTFPYGACARTGNTNTNLIMSNFYHSYVALLKQGEVTTVGGSFGNNSFDNVSNSFINRMSYKWGNLGAWNTLTDFPRSGIERLLYPGENSSYLSLTNSGFLFFRYQLDVNNNVNEYNESDNSAELMLYVTPANATPRLLICSAISSIPVGFSSSLEARFWTNASFAPDCNTPGYTVVTKDAGWSSSNTTVVNALNTLNRKGILKAVEPGQSVITASFSGYTATQTVSVSR